MVRASSSQGLGLARTDKGVGFWVSGLGFRVFGFGFRVSGLGSVSAAGALVNSAEIVSPRGRPNLSIVDPTYQSFLVSVSGFLSLLTQPGPFCAFAFLGSWGLF